MLRTANRANIGEDQGRVSAGEFRDWQAAAKSFENIAAYRWMTVDLLDSDSSERLQGLWVTPEFFHVFGIQASTGELFTSNDHFEMVIGKGLWQRRFGLDPMHNRNVPKQALLIILTILAALVAVFPAVGRRRHR
jgi:MacB-like periplasmic core domain